MSQSLRFPDKELEQLYYGRLVLWQLLMQTLQPLFRVSTFRRNLYGLGNFMKKYAREAHAAGLGREHVSTQHVLGSLPTSGPENRENRVVCLQYRSWIGYRIPVGERLVSPDLYCHVFPSAEEYLRPRQPEQLSVEIEVGLGKSHRFICLGGTSQGVHRGKQYLFIPGRKATGQETRCSGLDPRTKLVGFSHFGFADFGHVCAAIRDTGDQALSGQNSQSFTHRPLTGAEPACSLELS